MARDTIERMAENWCGSGGFEGVWVTRSDVLRSSMAWTNERPPDLLVLTHQPGDLTHKRGGLL